jgi:hypothetical protein
MCWFLDAGNEERLNMTINDEPVAEIDVRASYLTIFLALHGIQLPEGDLWVPKTLSELMT